MRADVTLYLVTDSTGMDEAVFLEKVDKACASGVTLVQLREKERTGREYLRLAYAVKDITDKYGIPLIIDDRIDIAQAVDAAGVHVGQSDLPVHSARKLLGPDKIVGATTKTIEQAIEAVREGASYLGVGAIYPTTTKVKTVRTEVTTLRRICETVDVPVVAIGGLNAANAQVLRGTGVAGIAVVSAIMKAEDVAEAVETLSALVATL